MSVPLVFRTSHGLCWTPYLQLLSCVLPTLGALSLLRVVGTFARAHREGSASALGCFARREGKQAGHVSLAYQGLPSAGLDEDGCAVYAAGREREEETGRKRTALSFWRRGSRARREGVCTATTGEESLNGEQRGFVVVVVKQRGGMPYNKGGKTCERAGERDKESHTKITVAPTSSRRRSSCARTHKGGTTSHGPTRGRGGSP